MLAAVAALLQLGTAQAQQPLAAQQPLDSDGTAFVYVADLRFLHDGRLDCMANITRCSLLGETIPERFLGPSANVTIRDDPVPSGRIALTGEQVDSFFALLDRELVRRTPPLQFQALRPCAQLGPCTARELRVPRRPAATSAPTVCSTAPHDCAAIAAQSQHSLAVRSPRAIV